jgi:holo-[acyl-carrier protein] synthase
MILGIGVDTVEIHRFAHWHTYGQKKLLRIFSQEEIEYCLQQPQKSAERFAVRFAAKEAFFKAFSAAYPDVYIPFLTVCRFVSIQKQDNSRPVLWVDWKNLVKNQDISVVCHVSLSHTQGMATSFVIIEKK